MKAVSCFIHLLTILCIAEAAVIVNSNGETSVEASASESFKVKRVQCPGRKAKGSALQMATRREPAVAQMRDGIQISKWIGRLGNNIQQLVHALVYAEQTGKSCVMAPPPPANSDMSALFRTPEVFLIQPAPSKASGCILRDNFGHEIRHDDNRVENWMFIHCKETTEDQLHKVLTKYVLPHKSRELSTCLDRSLKAKAHPNSTLLTVHLRNGDVFNEQSKHECHRQPPCALYDKIFERDSGGKPFHHMEIVMDEPKADEHANPCKDYLLNRHGDRASYSAGSMAQDACNILSAENLVAGFSTFSLYLALLSPSLKKIFLSNPAYGSLQNSAAPNNFPFDHGCSAPHGVALVRYNIADQAKYRPIATDNIAWMLLYKNISKPAVCAQ